VDRAAANHSNADFLSRALARSRRAALAETAEVDASGHIQAIDHLADYVTLLRETATFRYPLKLELGDGRWDVAEGSFSAKPQVGDLLTLPNGEWCVRGSQFVHPSVAGKPAREFIVCAAC
jgi:hypothetical protein